MCECIIMYLIMYCIAFRHWTSLWLVAYFMSIVYICTRSSKYICIMYFRLGLMWDPTTEGWAQPKYTDPNYKPPLTHIRLTWFVVICTEHTTCIQVYHFLKVNWNLSVQHNHKWLGKSVLWSVKTSFRHTKYSCLSSQLWITWTSWF